MKPLLSWQQQTQHGNLFFCQHLTTSPELKGNTRKLMFKKMISEKALKRQGKKQVTFFCITSVFSFVYLLLPPSIRSCIEMSYKMWTRC